MPGASNVVLSGSYPLSVDEKGRLAIPARLRQQLAETFGTQVYMTIGTKECIEIYPAPKFREIEQQIQDMDDQEAAEHLKMLFIGRAVDAEIDKQGRVTLPPFLRSESQIEGKVYLVGMGSRLDVWSEAAYHAEVEQLKPTLKSALAQIRR